MRVHLHSRARLGRPETGEVVLWPTGWPLPEIGSVVLGESVTGWVDHIEFDLPNGRIQVVLR